jgi:hypothetical protein
MPFDDPKGSEPVAEWFKRDLLRMNPSLQSAQPQRKPNPHLDDAVLSLPANHPALLPDSPAHKDCDCMACLPWTF